MGIVFVKIHLLLSCFGISGFMGMNFGKFSGFMGIFLINFSGFMGILLRNFSGFMDDTFTIWMANPVSW